MTLRARMLAGALMAAAPMLSGCVVAAIPVLAAGGVLKTRMDGPVAPATTGEPRVPIDISTAAPAQQAASSRSYTMADGTRMEVMTGPAAPLVEASAAASALPPPPLSATLPIVASVPSAETPAPLSAEKRTDPASAAPPAPSGPAVGPEGFTNYDPFYGFAESRGTTPVVGSERHSVMLAKPGTLAPKTADCSIYPAAVLIDLDPGTRLLDPATATHADPRLARTLAALRAQDISIGWISANTADRAGAVRRALVASGLDPEGRDELALLRYPEERKQTRREDFAKEFCVVAIAGDERGDFDELFQYLKDPAAAAPLEGLIGNGWFLIPQPLS